MSCAWYQVGVCDWQFQPRISGLPCGCKQYDTFVQLQQLKVLQIHWTMPYVYVPNECTVIAAGCIVPMTTGRSSRWAPEWSSWPRWSSRCSKAARSAAEAPSPDNTCRSGRTCWCCSCRYWPRDTCRHTTRCSPERKQSGRVRELAELPFYNLETEHRPRPTTGIVTRIVCVK